MNNTKINKLDFIEKKIEILKRNLSFAKNCDWAGQVIYCQILLDKYENHLLDIIFNDIKN